MLRSSIILSAALLCVSLTGRASAVTFDWNNVAGGGYSTAANWTPAGGPPANGDVARFQLNNTYTVTFSSSPNINTISQTQGDITLDFNGVTFTASNTTNNGMGSAGLTSTLRITDGNFRPGNFSIANVAGSIANLYLDIDSASRTAAGAFYVGSAGTGNLWIQNGATLQTNSGAAIGLNSGAIGTATVTGQNSNWTITAPSSQLRVGSAGTGTLNILSGGSVAVTGLEVGELLGSTGTVSLSGNAATLTASGTANIGGNLAASPAAAATLNIAAGATMSLNGTTNLRTNAKVNLSGGRLNLSTLNITSGATMNWTAGTLNFATGPAISTAVLDAFLAGTHTLGANRTLSATAGTMTLASALDLTGGRISVPILDINANMDLGSFSTVNATNTITIQPAATVKIRDFATVSATTSITNNGGTLLLDGPLAVVSGATTNTAGYIRGTGRFTGGLSNAAAGTVRVATGDHLIIDTAAQTNVGAVELAGGTIEYSEALTNQVGGTISGRGIFRGSAATPGSNGLTNDGVASFSAGVTDIFGDVNNTATGIVVAAGASTVTFYDDVINNGEIRTVTGSRTVFFGAVSGAGPFTGGGTVELEGDLKPGNSPANVSFGGNFVLSPTGGLDIELAGSAKGAQYDSLTIAGSASLGGALNASLINGFAPAPGQSFEILTAAGGIHGSFASANLPTLPGGLFFNLAYSPTAVTLSVAGMLGDYNRNGDIDAADFVVWRNSLNQSGTALAADGNGNGAVDFADFMLWRANYGTTSSATAGVNGASIPEPATIALLLFALIFRPRRSGRKSVK